MPTSQTIAAFLNSALRIARFTDTSNNGLQVANTGNSVHVACGVDASLEFFKAARARGADMVVCHHGLSWGDSLKYITGLNHQRLKFLIDNDMALYACHLPLDAHPRLGNNAGMARALGLRELKPFGLYHGASIGVRGRLPRPLPLARFVKMVERAAGNEARLMAFGRPTVRSVAMVVGGGAVGLEEAAGAGVDVYLSGEPSLAAYTTASDLGMNAVFAGHYATETFGVKALAILIAKKFKVRTAFIPMGVRY